MIHLHLFDKSTDKTVDKTLVYTSLFRQSDKIHPWKTGGERQGCLHGENKENIKPHFY